MLVPWAWGINGCATVVGTILAVIVAISWDFRGVSAAVPRDLRHGRGRRCRGPRAGAKGASVTIALHSAERLTE